MRLSEIYSSSRRKVLSLEFFPPKRKEELQQSFLLMRELALLMPDFITVTYGAGGTTRELTQEMVCFALQELQIPAVQHLTCVGHSVAEIDSLAERMKALGITGILALRGDPPQNAAQFHPHPDGFSCARDLVRHLSQKGSFSIAVAGYPEGHREASSRDSELRYLAEKIEAGAELIITQLFFEPQIYFDFVAQVRAIGITVPVVPGIMPVGNIAQLKRFTELCGASIPEALRRDLELRQDDPDEVMRYGTQYAIKQGLELLRGGAPGIHLYTLNRPYQAREVVRALKGNS